MKTKLFSVNKTDEKKEFDNNQYKESSVLTLALIISGLFLTFALLSAAIWYYFKQKKRQVLGSKSLLFDEHFCSNLVNVDGETSSYNI